MCSGFGIVGERALVERILRRLEPVLLQHLLQLREAQVGVLRLQSREVLLLEGGVGGLQAAFRVAVQLFGVGDAEKEMAIKWLAKV